MTEQGKLGRRTLLAGAGAAAGVVATAGAAAAAPEAAEGRGGELRGQVALITGAARGIGRATAVALARAGAHIVALDIAAPTAIKVDYPLGSEAELAETARAVRALGRRCTTVKADVRDAARLQEVAAQAVREYGRLDIAVANAGVNTYSPLADMSPRQFADVIDVNLVGVANTMRAVIPHLVARKSGAIIVVSSSEGRHGAPQLAHYQAAKWGAIGLVKAVATEVGPSGVRVSGVAPTGVRTPFVLNEATYEWAGGTGPEDLDRALRSYNTQPVGLIEPSDVADAITFLASPRARYISGTVLDVTAGASTRWSS
ncbi:mycofactocin-coupled SDR family oxidoreductase [Actinokineospora iranica]|uniref:SDR family mycofactocin-dependent oxidoreductase n=1 Tax=Actinokineospora iranica TaxID=1271860 RepID=A0A1G6QEJ8_9PSEU|nr:mycofactocin-coupled SDR family oxidoreductase [Actinokineospora iranica]SDC90728.1 SDR family mycofactocin-dependent oxidoreductase [Actinokineospora iranica]